MCSESVHSVNNYTVFCIVEICSKDDVSLESGAQIRWLPDEGGFLKDMASPGPTREK